MVFLGTIKIIWAKCWKGHNRAWFCSWGPPHLSRRDHMSLSSNFGGNIPLFNGTFLLKFHWNDVSNKLFRLSTLSEFENFHVYNYLKWFKNMAFSRKTSQNHPICLTYKFSRSFWAVSGLIVILFEDLAKMTASWPLTCIRRVGNTEQIARPPVQHNIPPHILHLFAHLLQKLLFYLVFTNEWNIGLHYCIIFT